MYKLLIALGIGIAAGLIDIVPMVLKKAPTHQIVSAFLHWVVVSVFISYVDVPLPSYVKGALVAFAATLPVAVGLSASHPNSVVPILAISIVLGAIVGVASSFLLARFV